MSLWKKTIAEHITETIGKPFQLESEHSVGGGCINSATVLEGGGLRFFVKVNDASMVDMFAAESEGLNELARTRALRVPDPVCFGVDADSAYLVMEHLQLGSGGRHTLEKLGRGLAAIHRVTSARFGWLRDNTIGSTPQINSSDENWVRFWQRHRLGFQLDLAEGKGGGKRLIDRGTELNQLLPVFFSTYTPVPSLLHGDLWSGNYSSDENDEPVIFDPAVYYGDRETDMAMTELFGGFGGRFFGAYNDAYPLDPDYKVRKVLYNLYHILNHFNLFGGGYRAQAEAMVDRLLAEIR
ncbi:MAG TPA: fructosamine kinase family protein [Acidiferrobacteraceae bacterium]|nr:fructosamine kinase family protein [Acidiferrobacteraceae bacterium]